MRNKQISYELNEEFQHSSKDIFIQYINTHDDYESLFFIVSQCIDVLNRKYGVFLQLSSWREKNRALIKQYITELILLVFKTINFYPSVDIFLAYKKNLSSKNYNLNNSFSIKRKIYKPILLILNLMIYFNYSGKISSFIFVVGTMFILSIFFIEWIFDKQTKINETKKLSNDQISSMLFIDELTTEIIDQLISDPSFQCKRIMK